MPRDQRSRGPVLAAVPDLEAELDALYAAPLERFTATRDDLAHRLRRAGQDEQAAGRAPRGRAGRRPRRRARRRAGRARARARRAPGSLPAQVGVLAAQPVVANRREQVEDDRVRERPAACGTFGGTTRLSPASSTRSSSPTTKRTRPSSSVATCSCSWRCCGTTAPAASSTRASVTRSALSSCRPIDGPSCSTGASSQRSTSTRAILTGSGDGARTRAAAPPARPPRRPAAAR